MFGTFDYFREIGIGRGGTLHNPYQNSVLLSPIFRSPLIRYASTPTSHTYQGTLPQASRQFETDLLETPTQYPSPARNSVLRPPLFTAGMDFQAYSCLVVIWLSPAELLQ